MSTTVSEDPQVQEKRRIARIGLSLPVKVEGRNSQNDFWSEVTRLKDVSAFGAGIVIERPVKRGRLVLLTFPMPRKMRCYDYMDAQYRVWGIVRRCSKIEGTKEDGKFFLGVAFIGKTPPKSYLDNPSLIYEITDQADEGLWKIAVAPPIPDESDLTSDERRHSRFEIPVSVSVEVIDEHGNIVKREDTVTENISLSGASVFSTIDVEVGSFMRVHCSQFKHPYRAVVRGKRIGPDSIPRLHIEFIDDYFPLEGIESD